MKCPKCGATDIAMAKDTRGLAEARCAVCNAYIKKMSVGDVVEYYENLLAEYAECAREAEEADKQATEDTAVEHAPCRFCTENYAIRRGRYGSEYYPLEAVYCPVCGRKLQESDRAY